MEGTQATSSSFFANTDCRNRFCIGLGKAAVGTAALFTPLVAAQIAGTLVISQLAGSVLSNIVFEKEKTKVYGQAIHHDSSFVRGLCRGMMHCKECFFTELGAGSLYGVLARTPVSVIHLKALTLLQFTVPFALFVTALVVTQLYISKGHKNYYELDETNKTPGEITMKNFYKFRKKQFIPMTYVFGVPAAILTARVALTLL